MAVLTRGSLRGMAALQRVDGSTQGMDRCGAGTARQAMGGASAWRSVAGAASVTAPARRWWNACAAEDGFLEKGGSSPPSTEANGGPHVDPQVGPCRRDRGS